MSSIAKNDIFYHHSYSPEQICKMIDQVTPQDIRRVARKILRDDKKSVIALGPKPTRGVLNRLKPVKPKRM
jgi:predicted Zn-dependent peptidase